MKSMSSLMGMCAAMTLLTATESYAQDPGGVANDRCWRAVVREARGRLATEGVMQEGDPRLSQESNAETRVSGSGSADGRPFSYTCVYNIRNGQTYGVNITPGYGGGSGNRPGWDNQRPGGGNYPGGGSGWNDRVPDWAIGRFQGYNRMTRSNVSLHVHSDGRVRANVDGTRIEGMIRDGILRTGPVRYRLSRTREGFTTEQIGNRRNVVSYRRVR